uniref:Uncharacterized protein n=1 Tax=Arundo donax TaxID=35708 RepID=A0A0A9EUP8_ARUDO
MCNIRLYSIEQ